MTELIFKHRDALLIAKALELAAKHTPEGEIGYAQRARLEDMASDLNLVLADERQFRILVRDPE